MSLCPLARGQPPSYSIQLKEGLSSAPWPAEPVPVQFSLPESPASPSVRANNEHVLEVPFKLGSPSYSLLLGKSTVKSFSGAGILELELANAPGKQEFAVTLVDIRGNTKTYRITAELELPDRDGDPKGFWLAGPVYFSRSVDRSGQASSVVGSSSASALGVRVIHRRRLFRDFTEQVPGKPRLFADLSSTLSKTIAGDTGAQGTPIWADGRLTLEIFGNDRMRFETGFGLTFFSPFPAESVPGDLDQFLGFLLSARLGYTLSPKLMALAGTNFAFPVTSDESGSTLTTQPLELFLSMGLKLRPDRALELRLKYFRLSTHGTVLNSGDFRKDDVFFGPEILYSIRI